MAVEDITMDPPVVEAAPVHKPTDLVVMGGQTPAAVVVVVVTIIQTTKVATEVQES
jgi:hypothetical protein